MDEQDGAPNANNGHDKPEEIPSLAGASQHQKTHQDGAPNTSVHSQKQKRFFSYLRKLRRAGPDRHIELVLSVAIASFALLQLIITHSNNKSTTAQMSNMLVAADRVDDAAESFSSSASGINGGVTDAVSGLRDQADKMDNARVSSETNAASFLQATIDNFHTDQRAWLGFQDVVVDGKTVSSGNRFTYYSLAGTLNSPAFVIFAARIVYQDIWQKQHLTRVCFYTTTTLANGFRYCPIANSNTEE